MGEARPELNFDKIDEAEYNRLASGYASTDEVTAEYDKTYELLNKMLNGLCSEYGDIASNNPGFMRTKFDMREHIIHMIDTRVKIIKERDVHIEKIATAALKFKADISKRNQSVEDSDEINAADVANIIEHTTAVLLDTNHETEEESMRKLDDALNDKQRRGEIEFSDGERLMMIPATSSFIFDMEESRFILMDENGEESNIIEEDLYPQLDNFIKEDGDLNIIGEELVNLGDDTLRYSLKKE